MTPPTSKILAINAGSSSIKFTLFEVGDPIGRVFQGAIEKIGEPCARLRVKDGTAQDASSKPVAAANYAEAIKSLMDFIEARCGAKGPTAIGHRVVQGGATISQPQAITPEVIRALRRLQVLDPQHMPEEIGLIEAFRRRYPERPQVACFDTAFHHDMPQVARLLAIPRRYEAQGVRRYGFHGLSFEYLMGELARLDGPVAASGRVILAHLGSGASLAAVRYGKSIDTSMGLTPAAGVPMSTRSGDLDPGLVSYLARVERMSAKRFSEMVNFESGLLGVSETSADMQTLLEREAEDIRAADAVALFCYQVKKWIGGFAAALGGVDTLIFAGGIGENAPKVRARICEGLGFLGIDLNEGCNDASEGLISPANGTVTVRVIHTDEEIVIARAVMATLSLSSGRMERAATLGTAPPEQAANPPSS